MYKYQTLNIILNYYFKHLEIIFLALYFMILQNSAPNARRDPSRGKNYRYCE